MLNCRSRVTHFTSKDFARPQGQLLFCGAMHAMDRLSLLIAYDRSCLVTYNNKLLCHRETHCSKRDKAGIRDQVVRGVRKSAGGREKKASWRPGLSTPTSGYFGEGVGFFLLPYHPFVPHSLSRRRGRIEPKTGPRGIRSSQLGKVRRGRH